MRAGKATGRRMSLAYRNDDCPHCADLRERVAWLESELSIQHDAGDMLKLKTAFGMTPQCARIVLALHAAKGAPVSRQRIEELTEEFAYGNRGKGSLDGETSNNLVSVAAHRVRGYLGHDTVLCLRGRGYALSDVGLAMVGEVLGK